MLLCGCIISKLSAVESKYSQARIAAPTVRPYEVSNLVRLADIFRPRQLRYPLHHDVLLVVLVYRYSAYIHSRDVAYVFKVFIKNKLG